MVRDEEGLGNECGGSCVRTLASQNISELDVTTHVTGKQGPHASTPHSHEPTCSHSRRCDGGMPGAARATGRQGGIVPGLRLAPTEEAQRLTGQGQGGDMSCAL